MLLSLNRNGHWYGYLYKVSFGHYLFLVDRIEGINSRMFYRTFALYEVSLKCCWTFWPNFQFDSPKDITSRSSPAFNQRLVTASMSSYEEIDPLSTDFAPVSNTHPLLQQILSARNRNQMFVPLASPASLRRNSSYRFLNRPHENPRHRSQLLLERSQTPAHLWEKFRKSDEELKSIKKKTVRNFYENQVWQAVSWSSWSE